MPYIFFLREDSGWLRPARPSPGYALVITVAAPVRLVDGPTYGEGRVNIYNELTGQWTPVCAEGWTKADSDVVCRQLGFFAGAADGLSAATEHCDMIDCNMIDD